MPLIKGKSKKAFEHNVEEEMDAHPGKENRAQNLAIAYSVKRKAKKKMAHGGMINESAASERRPMPDEKDKDAASIAQNSSKKPLMDSGALDQPTVRQAQAKPRIQAIKHPKMVSSSSGFTARLRDQEDDLEVSAAPSAKEDDDQMGDKDAMMDHFASGGEVRPDAGYGKIIFKSEGGSIDREEDMQPEDEEMEHHASIAAAIMAKKARQMELESGSEDEDHAEMYAEGGEILSHDSIYSDDSNQADLSRNADEDANEEDQLSYNALRKENYSESAGLDELDQPMDSNEHGHELSDEDSHDMVSRIRAKMMKKR